MHILVAGVGNIFLGDDAFGVEVARRMARRPLPEGVRVVDFGIRGYDLAYALMDGPDLTILVDAVPRGGVPGTLYTIEPDLTEADPAGGTFSGHGMNPMNVFRLVRAMEGRMKRLVVVGCEPMAVDEDSALGLSPPVRRAVDEAVRVVESIIEKEVTHSRAFDRIEYRGGDHRGVAEPR
ncbi:MAG TPA: hydrogenase maturation protease [Thermoanaerobaculia bacterium]|nr:hydrogenase maturation protease [Thermoanaerobaculia bacterium]